MKLPGSCMDHDKRFSKLELMVIRLCFQLPSDRLLFFSFDWAHLLTLTFSCWPVSRGLWTWPPWVICVPTFNHKIRNATHPGVSEVLLFTKSYKWKKQQWKKWTTERLLLETMHFWRSPMVRQFKMVARRLWTQQKLKLHDVASQWSNYSLLFPRSILFAEIFVTCLRNKAYVSFPSSPSIS